MKIIIDPEDDIQYMSFYIKGLEEMFGRESVVFNHKAFDELPSEERHTRTMRFIIKTGSSERRYTIDTNDSHRVNEVLYQWCDAYGSVNANFSKTPEALQKKLISLCPSFAIQYTHPIHAIVPTLNGLLHTQRNKRKYLGCWKRTMQRPRLEAYTMQEPREGYVFHLSTLWQSDEWNRNDEGVNLRRALFIRACKALGAEMTFEGGLVTSRTGDSIAQFTDCLSKRLPADECLQKTKESTFVFNTPAYWNCHGWKLGEYMALGKAILSTPLSNDLPSPLVEGEHIHYVDVTSPTALDDAIRLLLNDKAYRKHLENNIHRYWCDYGTPQASLRLMGITR